MPIQGGQLYLIQTEQPQYTVHSGQEQPLQPTQSGEQILLDPGVQPQNGQQLPLHLQQQTPNDRQQQQQLSHDKSAQQQDDHHQPSPSTVLQQPLPEVNVQPQEEIPTLPPVPHSYPSDSPPPQSPPTPPPPPPDDTPDLTQFAKDQQQHDTADDMEHSPSTCKRGSNEGDDNVTAKKPRTGEPNSAVTKEQLLPTDPAMHGVDGSQQKRKSVQQRDFSDVGGSNEGDGSSVQAGPKPDEAKHDDDKMVCDDDEKSKQNDEAKQNAEESEVKHNESSTKINIKESKEGEERDFSDVGGSNEGDDSSVQAEPKPDEPGKCDDDKMVCDDDEKSKQNDEANKQNTEESEVKHNESNTKINIKESKEGEKSRYGRQ